MVFILGIILILDIDFCLHWIVLVSSNNLSLFVLKQEGGPILRVQRQLTGIKCNKDMEPVLKHFQGSRQPLCTPGINFTWHDVSPFYMLLDFICQYFVQDFCLYIHEKFVVSLLSHVQHFAAHGLQPCRLLCPWDFPGKNTGVGCLFLLQGIFLTQGWNSSLVHWQADSLLLSTRETLLGKYWSANSHSFTESIQ